MDGGGRHNEVLHLPKRHLTPLPSPLSNSLIPRDFLGPRAGPQEIRLNSADIIRTSQPNSPPSTPSPDVDRPPDSILSSTMPSIANPHSPRPLQPKETTDLAQKEARGTTNRKISNPRKDAAKRAQAEHGNVVRKGSVLAMSNPQPSQQNLSPPLSPRPINNEGTEELKMTPRATVPRNSSIDSAISSISSSAENPHKASKEACDPNSAEVQQLIAAAGSPENLISHLLKERHHAASQNAQLWKLVDKQRALLLGLNQDLERALKDKEKYRHRAKELQAAAEMAKVSNLRHEALDRATEQEARSRLTPAEEMRTVQDQTSVHTPNHKPMNSLHSSPVDPSMIPSPLHLLQVQAKSQSTGLNVKAGGQNNVQTRSPESDDAFDTASTSSNELLVMKASQPGSRAVTSPPPADTQGTPAYGSSQHGPSDGHAAPKEASTSIPANGPDPKRVAPTRKAPPAPLNLNQSKPNAAMMMMMPNLAAVGRPSSENEEADERGRRKTREEDDRDRELVAKYEQEARSRSSKSSKSSKSGKKKIKHETRTDPPAQPPAHPPPAVPTEALQMEVPPAQFDPMMNTPSIDASLANAAPGLIAPQQIISSVTERVLVAPPMSPGLPISPRPADRPLGSPIPRLPKEATGGPLSPTLPLSPRGGLPGLPLSPRPPKSPLPIPHTPGVLSSPPAHPVNFSQLRSPRSPEFPKPTVTTTLPNETSEKTESPTSPFSGMLVDRTLMDPAYPKLLVTPQTLASVFVQVGSSRLRPKRNSYMPMVKSNEEEAVFTMSIFSRANGKEMWRIEKGIMALPQLDQQMKTVSRFPTKLPERKLFSGHSPATVDARRSALNLYFSELMEATVNEPSALVVCSFLSNDVIEARDDETSLLAPSQRSRTGLALPTDKRPKKEGYLTKRGKNFGGWKVRFFVLHGTELKYFESPDGQHLGTIKLQHAQIGKQTQSTSPSRNEDDVENQYRHAFLVLEPKRKDSTSLVRHVLCAESDHERDQWVSVLMQTVEYQSDDDKTQATPSRRSEDGKSHITGFEAKVKQYSGHSGKTSQDESSSQRPETDELKGIGYGQVAAGAAPIMGHQQTNDRQDASPSPVSTLSTTNPIQDGQSGYEQPTSSQGNKNISGPKHGTIIHDAVSWGNNNVTSLVSSVKENVKEKKRSMWGFRQRNGPENAQNQSLPNDAGMVASQQHYQNGSIRAVFGIPLLEAVEFCPPKGINVMLPAVVYRCIEYLQDKDAASEEGIFRLSGSNLVIKSLRERFNTEGDVDFLAEGRYYDVHAVASLFKCYLRELPSTVLTKELHLDFLHVLEMDDKSQKIAAFNILVHRLPRVNLSLLRTLSQYLIEVVNKSEKNKMNVRNMGIVFSPTLNIPAPVFGMFLTDFDAIFGAEPPAGAAPEERTRTVELAVPNQSTGDIRSPRRQMFSDLPTPSFNQTSFPQGVNLGQAPQQQNHPHQPVSNASLASNNTINQNTGFISMQPSYETRTYTSDHQAAQPREQHSTTSQPTVSRSEYGSMNQMLAPSNAASIKARRRESSMLFMGMGNREKGGPASSMVDPNTAFD